MKCPTCNTEVEFKDHFEESGSIDNNFFPPCSKCKHIVGDESDYPCSLCSRINN